MPRGEYAFRVVDILQPDRDAVKGAPNLAFRDLALGLPRLPERKLPGQRDERRELRLERADALEVRLRELDRGELARADETRSLRDLKVMELSHGRGITIWTAARYPTASVSNKLVGRCCRPVRK
jgi:hypothetical protein